MLWQTQAVKFQAFMSGSEDFNPNTQPLNARRRVAVAVAAENQDSGHPPRISAAGRGALADEILAAAYANGINVREDADLAEMLAVLDLETPIPPEAIIAVAEILAKVYEANQRLGEFAGSTSLPHASDNP